MELEIVEVKLESAVGGASDQPAHVVCAGWEPVRSQAHDFVFAFIDGKAQIRRKRRIKHAQRMWKSNFP